MPFSHQRTILFMADAPGPAEFILPVIPLIAKEADAAVLAAGKAVEVLTFFQPYICSDEASAREMYQHLKPDLLVAAISSLPNGPYVNNAVIECAYADGIPIICLQDFWANHRHLSNFKMLRYYTAVCTLDDFAATLLREDGFRGKIHVTGNPGFGKFAKVDVSAEQKRLRSHFKIREGERVVLYAGQGTREATAEADKKTFAFLADALRALGDPHIKLAVRPHPRAAHTDYYNELSHGISVFDTSEFEFTDELLPLADVVVSMFSTSLIHADCLRIPAVSILIPGAGRALLQDIGLDDFPSNKSGATVGVYEEDTNELCKIIKRIFNDEEFRAEIRHAQEKSFPLDSSAAEKAARVVLDIVRK